MALYVRVVLQVQLLGNCPVVSESTLIIAECQSRCGVMHRMPHASQQCKAVLPERDAKGTYFI